MKRLLRFTGFMILFLAAFDSVCQNLEPISLTKVRIKANSIGNFSLSIDFLIEKQSDEILDDEYNLKPNSIIAHLKYAGSEITNADNKKCPLSIAPYTTKSGFGFKITGFNNSSIKHFLDKDNQISVEVESDINIKLIKQHDTGYSRLGIIKKEEINKMIKENLSITDDERTSYLTYLNNFYYYQNSFDFGVQPNTDSSSTSYFVSFQVQNKYNVKRFLNCSEKKSSTPHLFWNLSGRLSTDFSDSLNYINYYPINLLNSKYDGTTPHEISFKLGNEANQTFSNTRIAVDGAYTFIIPNLINLTTTSSNRLRLKPIIILGMKGYYDYSKNMKNFFSGQAYLNFHYYIPIFNNYAVIIDETPFYDLSIEKNPNHKITNQYSIILGAEIPKTGFKAMFKYIDGTSNINYKQGKIIAIGLLMDFFQEKG